MAEPIEAFLLKRDKNIVSTSIFRLKQEYHPKKNTLHVFVENENDFLFYRGWIRNHFPEFKLFEYFQNGKDGVNDTYKNVNWNTFQKERVLFFRDKDYDDLIDIELINDHNFFVTKHYSIENYLVDESIF